MSAALPPFQRFLDSHRDAVWRFLAASVRADELEDCFQETFIAALGAYPRLRPDSNLRAWVLTIAHRKAIDSHRARARRATPVADVVEVSDSASLKQTSSASGEQLIAPEQRADGAFAIARDEALWSAVKQLPERQRSAVALRYIADLPHSEIAAALGCSQEAARRSLHEGLTKLRKVMQP